MNNIRFFLLVLVLAVSYAQAEKFRFNGYRLVRLTPKNQEQIKLIQSWENENNFDLWNMPKGINKPVDVALSPQAFETYKIEFKINRIEYEIIQDNIQDYIDMQEKSMHRNRNDRSIAGKFARYSEVISFLEGLAEENDFVSTYTTGRSIENRRLEVIKIKSPTAKKAVWIDCGIHAREWISPSSCVWIINSLVNDYKNNVQPAKDLLDYYEFHILPLHNPDGYEYSWTNYRLWRKNRNKVNNFCYGVDLNRNFGYEWFTGGSSDNPCSDVYAGPSADSELETKGVQSALNAKLGDWDAFFTIHTYGQWWFTIWGHTPDDPPNYADLLVKSKAGVDAIESVYGNVTWTYGSSSQILYVASGGSEDWAYGVANIPYTFCLELRPGQTGSDSDYGFILPEDRAPLAGEEAYQGIMASLQTIKP